MPAIPLDTTNKNNASAYERFKVIDKVLQPDKQKEIINSVFGPKQPEKSALEKAREARDMSYQEMLESQRKRLEQQRTSDVKMAKYNALGNLLTSMVQPIGWAAAGGGSTGGVQKYDDRQYLDSFNRAIKATDDLRNIGIMEDEYKFKVADEDYRRELALADAERQRAQTWEDFQKKQDYQAKIQSDLYNQRYEEEMNKIKARGENQVTLEGIKAKYKAVGRSGVPIEEKMLSTAWTKYQAYKDKYETDMGRGIVRSDKLKSFEEWVGPEYGWTLKPKSGGGSVQKAGSTGYVTPAGTTTKTPPSKQKQASTGAVTASNNSKTPPSKR